MKIREIYIDGFGHFHDLRFDDLSDSVTIFRGNNETGKTTLLEFLRRVLYGFPSGRGRSSENLYKPLSGGEHGGRLKIISSDGSDFIFERKSGMKTPLISDHDGSSVSDVSPHDLLGKADETFFKNVFAIGHSELREFSTLQEENIRDRMFSAGAGATAVPIIDLRKEIEEKKGKIFTSRGRVQKIPGFLTELDGVEDDIRNISEYQEQFDSFNDELDHYQREHRESLSKKNALLGEISHIENLNKAYEDYIVLKDAEKQLEQLPEISNFPPDGVSRLDRICESIISINEDIDNSNQDIRDLNRELENKRTNDELLENEKEIRALERGIEKIRSGETDLHTLYIERENLQTDCDTQKMELGDGWDEEKILSFDTSTSTQKTLSKLKKQLHDAKDAHYEAKKSYDNDFEKYGDIQGEIEQLDRQTDESRPVCDKEQLDKKIKDISILSGLITKCREQQSHVQQLREKGILQSEILNEISRGNRPSMMPMALILLAAFAVLVTGFVFSAFIPAMIGFCILILAALIYYISTKKGGKKRYDLVESRPELDISRKGFTELNKIFTEERKKLEKTREDVIQLARQCGFQAVPDPVALSTSESDLRDERQKAIAHESLLKRKKELDDNYRDVKSRLEEKKTHLEERESDLAEAIREWKAWLSSVGIDEKLEPDIVSDLLTKIHLAQQKYSELTKCKRKIQKLEQSLNDYAQRVDQITDMIDFEKSDTPDLTVELLAKELKVNQKISGDRENIKLQIDQENQKIERLGQKLDLNEQKKSELLSEATAADESQFREFSEIVTERAGLEKIIQQSRIHIRTICGDTKYEQFIQDLANTDEVYIESDLKEKKGELETIEGELSEISEKIGERRNSINELEKDNDLSALLLKESALFEEINDYSRQWAIYSIAERILNSAIELYERERQPVIIQEAQDFFTDITGKRYQKIISPLDSREIIVEESKGKRKEIGELSQGTAEQLYLSLRFGYIRDYSRNETALPVIFDDILVNFDPVRQRNACHAIRKLSETNQILYFTCHPETAEMLQAAAGDVKVVDLDTYSY